MDTEEVLKTEAETTTGLDIGQKIMIGVVVAAVLVGGYFVFKPVVKEPVTTEQESDQQAGALAALMPMTDGNDTYTLEKVDWVFEPQAEDEQGRPATRIRLQLVGLRRNAVPITVALYRLGTYGGSCLAFEDLGTGYVLPDEGAVAFAQCWFAGTGRQLAVFQEGTKLVVKIRMIAEEDEQLEPLVPILTIDVPNIPNY